MLPSWRDRLQVFLAPSRLDWVHFKRGFKPLQLAQASALFEPAPDAPSWHTALLQLDSVLAAATGADVSVTLSNHFVRYVALPPQNEINTPEEVKSYAHFRMREVYAERADTWILSISDWNPLNGAVCAAIPRDLMTELEQRLPRHGCALKTIEPYLASVYDRWYPQLQGGKIYLAVVETGRICLAICHNGQWQNIRNQRILHNVTGDLLAALDQEVIWSGTKSAVESVYLFAPEHPGLTLPQSSGWQAVLLPLGQIPAPAYYPSAAITHPGFGQCPA